MKSAVSVLYFIILQVLWIFRSLYELIMPEDNTNKNGLEGPNSSGRPSPPAEREKRHLIHLFTTTPKEQNRRPVCYMDVCEIISPMEEEMLRCTCGKGAPTSSNNNNNNTLPPSNSISRQSFTNNWMDSFSLVA